MIDDRFGVELHPLTSFEQVRDTSIVAMNSIFNPARKKSGEGSLPSFELIGSCRADHLDHYGDIDIAVEVPNTKIRDLLKNDAYRNIREWIGFEPKDYFGNQFTFPVPIVGTNKFTKMDLMFVDSLEAARQFYYWEVGFGKNSYLRGMLLQALAISLPRVVNENNGDEWRYWFDRYWGFCYGKTGPRVRIPYEPSTSFKVVSQNALSKYFGFQQCFDSLFISKGGDLSDEIREKTLETFLSMLKKKDEKVYEEIRERFSV